MSPAAHRGGVNRRCLFKLHLSIFQRMWLADRSTYPY
jgi:hypothetical protein